MTLLNAQMKPKHSSYGSFDISTEVGRSHDQRRIKCLIALQLCILALVIVMLSAFFFVAYPRLKEKLHQETPDDVAIHKRNIVTLYALDPIGHSFCFRDGGYGETITNRSIYNRCSNLEYEHYNNGSFTVGIEGGSAGVVVDLGSSETLQKKYKYQETVGNGQGFASIHRRNSTLLIAKHNAYDQQYQVMAEESAALFAQARSSASATVNLGHLYAVRVNDGVKPNTEYVVKMVVIGYRPHESVTFRWELMK